MVRWSYKNLGDIEAARPFARNLSKLRFPNWTLVKLVVLATRPQVLFTQEGRSRLGQMFLKCDAEKQAERTIAAWATRIADSLPET